MSYGVRVRRLVSSVPPPCYEESALPAAESCLGPHVRRACSDGQLPQQMGAKVIVLGDAAVGKTSLIRRFVQNTYERDYKTTIGVDFEVEKFLILNKPFDLHMWDTAGQERFKTIAAAYYRGANAIILTFDLCKQNSMHNARQWLSEAMEKRPADDCLVFLVGNKKDMMSAERLQAVASQAMDLSSTLNAEFWPVSAKSGENVEQLFTRVGALCFDAAAKLCIQQAGASIKIESNASTTQFSLKPHDTQPNTTDQSQCCVR